MTKYITDDQGNITLFQKPNIPLAIWLVATVVLHIVKTGTLHNLLDLVALVSIVIWATLEVLSGVNYFRRILGILVLFVVIYSRLR